MPYIEIAVYGRTVTAEQKERLFAGCVDVMERALGSRRSQVRIAVQPWPDGNHYDGGAGAEAKGDAPAERVGG